jgi:hypothetical protein
MSVIGRIVGLAVVGMAGAMAVGAAGAMSAKQRIVPTTDPADDEITLASIFGPLADRKIGMSGRARTRECASSNANARSCIDRVSPDQSARTASIARARSCCTCRSSGRSGNFASSAPAMPASWRSR